jgi:hypothetical protein
MELLRKAVRGKPNDGSLLEVIKGFCGSGSSFWEGSDSLTEWPSKIEPSPGYDRNVSDQDRWEEQIIPHTRTRKG